jgi:zinc/manganese transport system substrate-binding protein
MFLSARNRLCALAGAGFLLLATSPAFAAGIPAVGIENEYADVIAQVGGPYVSVTAIETNPNTDPHSFEASPRVARQLAAARLIVKNGLGYDSWANRLIAATHSAGREVIDVQKLRGLPDSTPNPHLWYDPATMPAVAAAVAADLSRLDPAHAALFAANAKKFDASLTPWRQAIAAFKANHPHVPVAVTEPVADYMLQAMGADIKTPFSLQSAVMNGTDPSPQDVTAQMHLLTHREVAVFVYNQQATAPLTDSFLAAAKAHHVPVVGVYETMPTGYHYQGWMLAEVNAMRRAVTAHQSTETLQGGHAL